MDEYKPKSISRPKPYLIKCIWPDGFESVIKLEKLRAECPCAGCGKNREQNTLSGGLNMLSQFSEGMNELTKLILVGNYALKAVWADGHDVGIYNFELLREIFEKHKLTEKKIAELEEKFG